MKSYYEMFLKNYYYMEMYVHWRSRKPSFYFFYLEFYLELDLELELILQTPLFPVPYGLWTPNLAGW